MPDPAGKSPPGSGVDRENMRKCTRCLENKPVSEFHKDVKNKDGLRYYCRPCSNRASKEHYEKNKERGRPRRIERTFGITIEDYNNLLDQQNNCCAICGGVNEDGKALSIDHDHSCCPGRKSCGKCVRQILCNSCNSMLGYARDDIEILEAAKKYLERHSRPKNLAKNLD